MNMSVCLYVFTIALHSSKKFTQQKYNFVLVVMMATTLIKTGGQMKVLIRLQFVANVIVSSNATCTLKSVLNDLYIITFNYTL